MLKNTVSAARPDTPLTSPPAGIAHRTQAVLQFPLAATSTSTPALDQLRASVSQLAASNEKTHTILKDVTSSSVNDDLEVVRQECNTLRSMIDELRHEVDTTSKERSTTAAGGSDENVLRLSQTVSELSAHVKNKGTDFRRSTVQISDMTERMIQTAIADLRDEFICVHRDNSTPLTLSKQYESMKRDCEELREELAGLKSKLNMAESRLATFREESAHDNERMELQRRQVATIVAELDRIKTMIRAS